MYYVTRKGKPITEYHARFNNVKPARAYADDLKSTFGHQYDVIKLETVYTTQTLEEAMAE